MSSQDIYTTIRRIEVGLIDGRSKNVYPGSEYEQQRIMSELKEAIKKDSFYEDDNIIILGSYIEFIESSTQRVKVPELSSRK